MRNAGGTDNTEIFNSCEEYSRCILPELKITKEAYEKFRNETLSALEHFKDYKSKLEKNAELHKSNIYQYISLIEQKNKIIEMLRKHHESCNLGK